MFFHYHEPLGFLNGANDANDPFGTRRKQYESTSEQVSGILYGLTYWGDYGGDSVSRYHYDYLLENAGNLVTSVEGNYGKGLVLTHVYYPVDENGTHAFERSDFDFAGESAIIREFVSWAIDAPSNRYMTRKDYPIFDDNGFSDWEFEKVQSIVKSDVEGWMGQDVRREFDKLTDWEFDGEVEDSEILDAISYLLENGNEYPYFEDAVNIILPGIDSGKIAERILAVKNGTAQQHQEEVLF